jgi:MFS family permease
VLSAFAGLATAFVAVYATEQRELPASIAGRFTAWMLGAQIIATPLFGMLADRHGYKPSLQFALLAQTVAMILSLIVTTPLGFSIVFALIGAATGLVFATTLNMVVEFATPPQRVTYLGLHGTLIALPTLLAPLLGGWLVEAGGYPLAFIAAAIFGIAAFVLLTWFVRDPRHRQLAMATAGDVRS